MKYIHQLKILHRNLKPANILLDEFLHPKLADFGLSKCLKDDSRYDRNRTSKKPSGFKGTYAYCSLEIIKSQEYSYYGDIYAYGMLVYEIMTCETIFEGWYLYKLLHEITHGYRPEFKYMIPYCYRKLIEKCWSTDIYERPDFNSICELLKNNPEFITENVDQEQFLEYVEMVDDYLTHTETKEVVFHKPTENTTVNQQDEDNDETDEIKLDKCFINIREFEKEKLILKRDFSKLYKIKELKTGNSFIAQVSSNEINDFSDEEIQNISIELNKISQLNNKSILKFIGYSPINFKNLRKPVIITEYIPNGTLDKIIEFDRVNNTISGWNDTKKLINIFGIAFGMKYLHSCDIIHCNLKTKNIFLDDFLLPKIGDFGLSTRFLSNDKISHQTFSGAMINPIYSAPEVLQSNEYSKSSDVYSFAIIVYEIITSEIPFVDINNTNNIYNEVVIKNNRPKFNKSIPDCYHELIEKCWSQNPDERPSYDEIVSCLKNNTGFITSKINRNDYLKYKKLMEENQSTEKSSRFQDKARNFDNFNEPQKIVENPDELPIGENLVGKSDESTNSDVQQKIEENSDISQNNNEEQTFVEPKDSQTKENLNDSDDSNEQPRFISRSIELTNKDEALINLLTPNQSDLVFELISSKKEKELMKFLNDTCDNNITSAVFNKCYIEEPDLFLKICKERISLNNPVAHHKYAVYLIYGKSDDQTANYKKAQKHLEESIKQGFALSCFRAFFIQPKCMYNKKKKKL